MNDIDDELIIDIDAEELSKMARAMADALVERLLKQPDTIYAEVACAYAYEVINENEVTKTIVLDLVSSGTAGITDPLGQLRDWFTSVLNSIASWIVAGVTTFLNTYVIPVINAVTSSVTTFIDTYVVPAITSLGTSLMSAITSIPDTISGFITSAVTTLSSAFSSAVTSITTAFSTVASSITGAISGAVQSIASSIGAVVSTVTGFVSSAIGGAITAINNYVSSIASGILRAIGNITNAISGVVSSIVSSMSGMASTIISGVTTFVNAYIVPAIGNVSSIVSNLFNTVLSGLQNMANTISAGFSELGKVTMGFINAILQFPAWFPDWFQRYIAKPIVDTLSKIGDWIWRAIPDWLRSGLSAISDFFTKTLPSFFDTIAKGFQDFIKDPLGWLGKNLVTPILNGFKAVGDWLWGALPQWLKDIITGIGDFFTKTLPSAVETFIKGAQDFVKDPLGWIDRNLLKPLMSGLGAIGNWIWNALPDWLKSGLTALGDFFTNISTAFTDYVKDPWTWINKNILQPVMGGLKVVWDNLVSIGNTLWSWMTSMAKWLSDAFGSAIGSLVSLPITLFQMITSQLTAMAEGMGKYMQKFLSGIGKEFSKGTMDYLTPQISKTYEQLGIGTPKVLTQENITAQLSHMFEESVGVLLIPFIGQLVPRLITRIAIAGGKFFEGLHWTWHINLKPIGIGIEDDFDVGRALGASLYSFGEEAMDWLRTIGNTFAINWGFWLARPQARLLTYIFRNAIPIELPPQTDVIEFTRRVLPISAKKDVYDMAKFFLAIYGYSDWVLDMYFEPKDQYVLTVTDRFNVSRTIPLSLVYELPSASDVATMMVRDIFKSPDDFKKIYLARGMHEDVGSLYYYLRFRYPPPERLWQFTTRGISGLLWATISPDELADIQAEAGAFKAPVPVSAQSLNFKAPELFGAFKTYMKWHDYARWSWIPREEFTFTSDNQIMTDTLADIPTKIDQRWMTRFGIYEFLAEKNVGLSSPISEFRTKVMEPNPISSIQMDLSNFCRTLQATGLHPDWVPLTAVAETINSITDERTLLRTGALNLFREGFWNYVAIDSLFSGLLKVSFRVSAFNASTMKWESGYINMPMMFLPAERNLTEVRALMDRSFDILREFQRDLTNAYVDNIVKDYDNYKQKMTDIINDVNEFFATDYKNVVGTDLPEQLKLTFVEQYYKPYVNAMTLMKDVYIVRRLRAWTMRWVGWIMYRMATGVTTKEEFNRLIDVVSEQAMLSDKEKKFISDVMDVMGKIAVKEYIPTPSQLATLSEYVVIPSSLIEQVFDARLVPQEWRPIWRRYIDIRPIADDVKSLVSTYMYVLRYVKVSDEDTKQVMSYARMVGYGDKEMALFSLTAKLNEMLYHTRQNVREYIPTPSMLASMAEYVPEVREFFNEVMTAKGVPSNWQPLWAKYIDIRPLVDDVKRYFARAEELYIKFMMKEDAFKKVLDEVQNYLGYTNKEIDFLLLTTKYERWRNAWNELIGTVEKMTMVAEYSPVGRDYAVGKLYEMIDALPITDDEKKKLKKMWEQYIRVRPVYDEVRRYVTDLINAFVDGTISESIFSSELESLKEWGLGDDEIQFYKAMAGLRRARKLKITLY